MGPKTEVNMNTETSVDMPKSNKTADEQAVQRGKKKSCEEIESIENEDQNACAKIRRTGEEYLNTENCSLPTRLEVIVLNGKWDKKQTFHSKNADMQCITIQDLDVNEMCIPRIESGGIEITLENIDSIFKQFSESATCMNSNLDFSESIPLTEHSETECKHINDTENNCDDNLSWLINFKVGALFNAAEAEHVHEGRREEEITNPGICWKY